MGRADRLRERFENERLRNIMVVPMFAAPKDAAAIRNFTLSLKPATQLAVEDTDVLRVHIATESRRPPRKSKLLNNTVLSRWAGMRFEDDSNKRQLVGVIQVNNAVLDHAKGAAGGKRMFLDEDEEVWALSHTGSAVESCSIRALFMFCYLSSFICLPCSVVLLSRNMS